MNAQLWFDGACRGNPGGPSAGAAVLKIQKPPEPIMVHKPMRSDFLGMGAPRTETIEVPGPRFHGTNNEAEWKGLILGLHEALKRGVTHLQIYGDSKLVVQQVKGEWKVHKAHLKPFRQEAIVLLDNFESWTIEWTARVNNQEADRVANEALDRSVKRGF